ncbi:MAG: nucleoside 2-deoxyribosyltransferase [Candidatus Hinthialibacter antarcticus]|nr:nucleoside 2-deoxyribosyltransferase [Candidatus Hinthialibacter antarcticus]
MKLFISSPLGFAESTTRFRETLQTCLQAKSLDIIDPWSTASDLESEFKKAESIDKLDVRNDSLHSISMKIAERNAANIRECELMLAVLDGVDVDSGTASEIGYAFALGKRIYGLRTDFRRAGENEGVCVNLQVQYWIEASGGCIVRSVNELEQLDLSQTN